MFGIRPSLGSYTWPMPTYSLEPASKIVCSLEGPLDLALELHIISISFARMSELERANLEVAAEENESRKHS